MFRMYEWKPNDPASKGNNALLTDKEPQVTFSDNKAVVVFVLASSALFFNREDFPNDSYRQAAKRTLNVLDVTLGENLKAGNKSFNFRLKEYKEFGVRSFEILANGTITHNYEVDTWHWWFLEDLSKLVREKYHT